VSECVRVIDRECVREKVCVFMYVCVCLCVCVCMCVCVCVRESERKISVVDRMS